MNRIFRNALLAIGLLALALPAVAQQMPQMPQLPVDQDVRIGHLPNGMTYYIRHNEYPKGQADFYIAQKVGSILENDDQRGLAHFLEHMCFNGTTHFPGKDLINWLESVGVKFGVNLNAYTAVDQTVYNISNVPVARQGVQDSCLLVLHDWANDLLLLPEEIDAERGVIHEEWRRSMVGQMRILESLLPQVYPGTPYGYRLPIGTMEVVDNFPPKALRDYYEKWYRPDLQGIIVVGDIDADRIEAKIKEMFADIEMPADPAERIYFPVPDTQGTIYAIGHDKEQNSSIAQLFIKSDPMPDSLRNTQLYYVQDYLTSMITSMLNTRLNDISSKPGAPFAGAGANYGNFFLSKTKDAFTVSALATSSDQLPTAISAAYRELLRAVRGGFTVTEYERAKAEYLSRMEKAYNNRNQRENGTFVNEYVDNFLDGDPIPGIETDYELAKGIAAMIPVQAVNMTLQQLITPDNRILMALMPDNAEGKYPTEQDFASALQGVESENIEAFKEVLKDEPLIPTEPKEGTITNETVLDQFGATQWTLSNGVTVILKPTKFKEDEILFNATAHDGWASRFGDKYANSIIFLPAALRSYGLGTYTEADLQKYLAGKQVSVHPEFDDYSRVITGSTTPKDIETFFQILYMNFTGLNFSADEFAALQSTYAGMLHNQEANPQYIFQTRICEALYSSPMMRALSVEAINGASREQVVEVCRAMTANAADYTFTFVGNFDIESIRPLVTKYIASLPGNAKKASKPVKKFSKAFMQKPGTGTDAYTCPMQTPQTWVYISEVGNMPYTTLNQQLASIAGQILSNRLLDIVREKEGATYSISASCSMSRTGANNVDLKSAFPMKPEFKDNVLSIIHEQVELLANEISTEELNKAKEYMTKVYTEAKEKNSGWIKGIAGWNLNKVDTFNESIPTLQGITTQQVKDYVKALNAQGNYRVVLLDPAE